MDARTITLILTISGYVLFGLLNLLALLVVPRNRKPASGTAWLLVIFLLPVVGWLLFLLLGSNKLPKNRRLIQQDVDEILDKDYDTIEKMPSLRSIINVQPPKKYRATASLAKSLGHLPVVARNDVQLITQYQKALDSIVEDIESAEKSVYIGYYIITLDACTEPLFVALENAKQRGVDIKVLYDAYGSRGFKGYRSMKKRLDKSDISHYAMLPFTLPGKNFRRPDLRNHRKVVVIDQKIGYTGSQNLVAQDYHRRDSITYNEFVARVEGPIVYELKAIFLADWHAEAETSLETIRNSAAPKMSYKKGSLLQMLPSGPGYADENNLKVFVELLYAAERSITIVNPYFVPPEPLLSAIVSAARRGVYVQMVNSEAQDQWMVAHAQRSYYETLLLAGVDIYLYKKPSLLHTKTIVIDAEIAVIGSSNMDFRSFELIHELSLICYDPSIARKVGRINQRYLSQSRQISLDEWQQRKNYKKIIDNLARLTSTLQ